MSDTTTMAAPMSGADRVIRRFDVVQNGIPATLADAPAGKFVLAEDFDDLFKAAQSLAIERAEFRRDAERLRAGVALCLYFGRLGKEHVRVAVLDAPMLREALAFVSPDGTPEQDEEAVVLAGDWGHSGRGVYCYLAECPEEGSIKLTGDGYEVKAKRAQP